MYSSEEITTEFEALEWLVPSPEILENRIDLSHGKMPLLFRGHGLLSPHALPDSNEQRIIHATPHVDIATSVWKFKLSIGYRDFPSKAGFVSVYAAHADQIFYPDEVLEHAVKGLFTELGSRLADIKTFDPVRHFETAIDLNRNPLLATYLYKHDGTRQKWIAPLSERLLLMLETNAKNAAASSSPQRNNPHFQIPLKALRS